MSWKQVNTAFGEPSIKPGIKWKRCDIYSIVDLLVDGVTNEKRQKVIDSRFAKFRAAANSLVPRRIYNTKKDFWENKIHHKCGHYLIQYEIGFSATPNGYTSNPDIICGKGVHFSTHCLLLFGTQSLVP